MRHAQSSGGFFICFLLNLFLNLAWSIPAWLLLVAHAVLLWPLWLFWLALGLWGAMALILTAIIAWSAKCAAVPTPERENKNPYSYKKPEK